MNGESPKQEELGLPVDFMRLAIAFKQRRWGIAGATIIGAVAGVGTAKTLVPQVFEARSIIECERCAGSDSADRELVTLQECVKLPHHLEIARQKLGLDTTLERIGRDVDVSASIESRLIQVTGRAHNADTAAALANVIVDAFLESRLQVERDKLEGRVGLLEKDAERARKAIIVTREQFNQFRNDNNIADLPIERQGAIQEAARLRSAAAMARAEEQAEQARIRALERASTKEPSTTILQQVEHLPVAKRLSETKTNLTSARAQFSADHPRVLALAAEVEMLERKLAASNEAVTIERVVGRNPQWESAQHGIVGATADHEAAITRESTYEKLAQNAARAAARLTSMEGQASELLSNLQNAERHLAALEADKKIAEDAAHAASTGVRILAPARPPSTPVKSSRRIAAVLGPAIGCILAALGAILYELRGFRIRTAEELAFWGQGPVLASSRWPTSADTLDNLACDIAGPLRETKGKTLLIGAGPNEIAVVEDFARAIREEMSRQNGAEEFGASAIETPTQQDDPSVLRRAARTADRVVICVSAGRHSAFALRAFMNKMAFSRAVGFILVDLHEDHIALPDLIGDGRRFWNA